MARGGKREGAGRKKSESKMSTQSFTLDKETIQTINELAEILKTSKSKVIRMAIHDIGVTYDIVDGPWID